MPRGNWGIFTKVGLTIAAFAVILGSGFLIYRALELQRTYQIEARESAYRGSDRASIKVDRNCVGLAPTPKAKCAREIADANRENQRKEYDLEAQRTTAIWTGFMGAAALVGMAFSIIGVGLIFVTFQATRQANNISRQLLENETRPLAIFEGFVVQRSDAAFSFHGVFRNGGNGPMRVIAIKIRQNRIPRPEITHIETKLIERPVSPSDGRVFVKSETANSDTTHCSHVEPKRCAILLECEILYDNPTCARLEPYVTVAKAEVIPVITHFESSPEGEMEIMGSGKIIGDISAFHIKGVRIIDTVYAYKMT